MNKLFYAIQKKLRKGSKIVLKKGATNAYKHKRATM
jgi:hypothetical protein